MDVNIPEEIKSKVLEAITRQESNFNCADCDFRGPEWYSLSFGAFVCFKCSGAHRSLGTNITRVKSAKLDYWNLLELFQAKEVDNDQINEYYENNKSEMFLKPNHKSTLEELQEYAKKKYVKKMFTNKNEPTPVENFRKRFEEELKATGITNDKLLYNHYLLNLRQEFGVRTLPNNQNRRSTHVINPMMHFQNQKSKELENQRELEKQKLNQNLVQNPFSDDPNDTMPDLFKGLNLKRKSFHHGSIKKLSNDFEEENQDALLLSDSQTSSPKKFDKFRKSIEMKEIKEMNPFSRSKTTPDLEIILEKMDKSNKIPQEEQGNPPEQPRQSIENKNCCSRCLSASRKKIMQKLYSNQKPLMLIGCFLVHLTNGIVYSWGCMAPYLSSYYHDTSDEYAANNEYNYVILFMFLGFSVSQILSEFIISKFGALKILFIAFSGLIGNYLFCYITDVFELFLFLYLGLIPGFLIGALYNIPYICLQKFNWADHKYVKCCIYFSNGIGVLLFNVGCWYFINPDDVLPFIRVHTKEGDYKVYPPGAGYRLYDFFYVLPIVLGMIGSLAWVILYPTLESEKFKEPLELQSPNLERGPRYSYASNRSDTSRKSADLIRMSSNEIKEFSNFRDVLFSKEFFYIISMSISAFTFGGFLTFAYKEIGITLGISDKTISIAGGFAFILMGIGKMVGVRYFHRRTFCMNLEQVFGFQAFIGLLGAFVGQYSIGYLFIMFSGMALQGFIFGMITEEVRHIFGKQFELKMVGIIYAGYAVSLVFAVLLTMAIASWGSYMVSMVLASPLLISFGLAQNYFRA